MSFVGGVLLDSNFIRKGAKPARKKRRRAWAHRGTDGATNIGSSVTEKENRSGEIMVTVDPQKPIPNIKESNKTENRTKVQKGGFETIFQQVVGRTESKGTNTESTRFISEIRPTRFSTESLPSTNRVVDQVQRLIDTMGVYQQKLIESGATLRDIQTLVQQMASQSGSLSAASSAVEEQDSLKTIANQSLTLASMEITRFNSGYYNDG